MLVCGSHSSHNNLRERCFEQAGHSKRPNSRGTSRTNRADRTEGVLQLRWNLCYCARLYLCQYLKQLWYKRQQIRKAIALCTQKDESKRLALQLLLEGDALIHGDERIEFIRDGIEKLPIVERVQAGFPCSPHLVPGELQFEALWQAGVKQDAHGLLCSLFRGDICQRSLARHFEHRYGVLPRYIGKVFKEHIERIPSLKVIEKRLYWHARAREHWRTAKPIGIG